MQYTKLQLKSLRGEPFASAEPAARGNWLSLIAHCADQENGGRIAACAAWTDRRWMPVGVQASDVAQVVAQGLGRWDGDDLVVLGYDILGEQSFREASAINQVRAKARWDAERRKPAPRETMPPAMPGAVPAAMPAAQKTHAAGNAGRSTGGNAHSNPIHTIPIQKSSSAHERPREALAAAADLSQDQEEIDIPEAVEQARVIAVGLGGRDSIDGKDLGPEWLASFRGLTVAQVQEVWVTVTDPRIRLPSGFDAARKAWRHSAFRREQNATAEDDRKRREANAQREAKDQEGANAAAIARANVRAEGIRRLLTAIEQDPTLLDGLTEGEQQRLAMLKAYIDKGDNPRACLLSTTMRDHLPTALRALLDNLTAAEGTAR